MNMPNPIVDVSLSPYARYAAAALRHTRPDAAGGQRSQWSGDVLAILHALQQADETVAVDRFLIASGYLA